MNTKSQIAQIRTIFFVVLIGLALLGAGAFILVKNTGVLIPLSASQNNTVESLVMLVVLSGIPLSHFLHRRKIAKLNLLQPLKNLLVSYKSVYMLKLGVLEGLGFINILAFVMSDNTTYMLILLIILVVVALNYPSMVRIAEELNLEDSQSLINE